MPASVNTPPPHPTPHPPRTHTPAHHRCLSTNPWSPLAISSEAHATEAYATGEYTTTHNHAVQGRARRTSTKRPQTSTPGTPNSVTLCTTGQKVWGNRGLGRKGGGRGVTDDAIRHRSTQQQHPPLDSQHERTRSPALATWMTVRTHTLQRASKGSSRPTSHSREARPECSHSCGQGRGTARTQATDGSA